MQVDLASGEGLAECLEACGPLAAVVNCAAVSSPAACEQDPKRARYFGPHARCRPLSDMQQHSISNMYRKQASNLCAAGL